MLALLDHGNEARLKWTALGIAIAIHLVLMLINFPEIRQAVQPRPQGPVLIVRKYIPPPPKLERPQRTVVRRELTRRIPIPDPTPDEPEPIREPEPDIVVPPLPEDVEVLIGVPEPPGPGPGEGPRIAGTGGVTMPALIPESKIAPQYPELARVARIEGRVILQAVICPDGSVSDLVVVRCSHPRLGFEEAAVDAVRQWRYTPATLDGRPVSVYFTVLVDFELL
ncbi:MAG TPA: energy transducer TonB [Candidatus Polarisedimenticolaceae bacterium]|nr:energy transducer TonB [Candidatus Polarisedimenticolaceae bacterium]